MTKIFDLPEEVRKIRRVNTVRGMIVRNVGSREKAAYPIELFGDSTQVESLIDLLWNTIPKGRFSLIIDGKIPDGQAVAACSEVITALKEHQGSIKVPTAGEICVLKICWDHVNNLFLCDFGYTFSGLTISENDPNGIHIGFDVSKAEQLVELSLLKLYQITGKVDFISTLASRKRMIAQGVSREATPSVDPHGYYSILGLDPNMTRFMSKEMVNTILVGIKRQIARALHPDVNTKNDSSNEYLQKALEAVNFLSDEALRNAYTRWI